MSSKPGSKEILAKLHKDYGPEIGGLGDKYVNLPRLPTNIFALDLALGGGFPMGKLSIIFGPESSNKTNTVLGMIVVGQLMFPDKKAVFIDAEQALDPTWAKRLGVDMDRLIVIHPDYAEQTVDIVEAFLHAEDIFMVALDSIAALITSNEVASGADKMIVGGSSMVVSKMVKKAVLALSQARKQNKGGYAPAFICVNQIRHKIGVMFGDPETFPGGNALKYASSCTLRLYGKNEVDTKVNDAMPAYKSVSAILKKWKMPILQVKAEYRQQMLEFNGNPAGYIDDFNTVYAYLKELGYVSGKTGNYTMFNKPYKSIKEMQVTLYGNPKLLIEAKQSIILDMMAKGHIEESTGEIDVDPDDE